MNEKNTVVEGFYRDIEFKRGKYAIYIQPAEAFPENEKLKYGLNNGGFIIHLYSTNGLKIFNMYMNNDLMWTTDASGILIDQGILEEIGNIIEKLSKR